MTTLAKVDVTRDWTLVYDSVVSGPFVGFVASIGRSEVAYRVDTSLPSSSSSGIPTSDPVKISLSADGLDKLYAKSAAEASQIILDDSLAPDALPKWLLSSDAETSRLKVSINEEVFDGLKAITIQPFTEVNSKLGRQYQAAFFQPSLAISTSTDIAIIVGASPMIFKDIQVSFDSTLISAQIFRGPTYSGGTPINIYNMNDEQAVAPVASLLGGVTTTATGTAVGPEIYSLGGEGIGNRTIGSVFQGSGVERILWPGETYLYRITNKDTTLPSRITGVATWYQGPLSTETPLIL